MTHYLIGAAAGAALVLLVCRYLASRKKPSPSRSAAAPTSEPGDPEDQLIAALSVMEGSLRARVHQSSLDGSDFAERWFERCASVRRFVEGGSNDLPSPVFGRGMSETSFQELTGPGYELDDCIRRYLEARGL